MSHDTEAHLAEHRARSRARVVPGALAPSSPSAAVIADRTRANIEGQGKDVRDSVSASTFGLAQSITRALNNPTLGNEAQRAVYVADLAKQRMSDSIALIETRRGIVAAQQARVAAEVDAAYQPRTPAHAALAPEIRAMLRAMPEGERDRLLNSAKGTADYIPMLYAVTSAPAALSGVAPGQQIEMRRMALAIKDPSLLSLPDEIAHELKLLDECEDGVRRTVAELVDFDSADALKRLNEPS